MVEYKQIEYIIIKCSNDSLREKYSRLSNDELKEKLTGKMNPLEWEDYEGILNELEFYSLFDEKDISPDMRKEIEDYQERLFEYNKRIDRGYDLDKNKSNVPNYDLSDFVEDNFTGMYDNNLGEHETNQIQYQDENLTLTEENMNALRAYFGSDYAHINGEVNKDYKEGYWDRLSEAERREYHNQNLKIIPNIDETIKNSPGLITSTVLYHGTNDSNIINIHTRVGDNIKLKGYTSTSFNKEVGKGYGSMSGAFVVQFLAPKGLKGVCANTHGLTGEIGEHEYLLGKGVNGTVLDIDYNSKPPLCRILLE